MAGAGPGHLDPEIAMADRPKAAVRCKGKNVCKKKSHLTGLGRPGSDLLSHALRRSTIGARGLNDGVRDGIRWGPPAITTRSAETS